MSGRKLTEGAGLGCPAFASYRSFQPGMISVFVAVQSSFGRSFAARRSWRLFSSIDIPLSFAESTYCLCSLDKIETTNNEMTATSLDVGGKGSTTKRNAHKSSVALATHSKGT